MRVVSGMSWMLLCPYPSSAVRCHADASPQQVSNCGSSGVDRSRRGDVHAGVV